MTSPGRFIGRSCARRGGREDQQGGEGCGEGSGHGGRQHASAAIGAAPLPEPTLGGWMSSPSCRGDRRRASWRRRSCSASSRKRSALEILDWKPTRSPAGRGRERDRRPRADDRGAERDPPPARQARADARGHRVRVARVLIVPCGERGRALARELRAAGHAVRGTTRGAHVAEIAATGAEPYVGDPDRIATLMDALHGVTIVVLADRHDRRRRPARRPAADAVGEAGRHPGARRRLRRHAPRGRGDLARVVGDLADPARGARRRSAARTTGSTTPPAPSRGC